MRPNSYYAKNEEIKEKFAKAKAFITVEQYDKARAILKTIDHPTAQKWLEKLDVIAPEKPEVVGLKKSRRNLATGCFMFLLICGALYIVSPRTTHVAATPTIVAAAATLTTDTPATATLEASATPSATITETSIPTATITDTPSPTVTATSTLDTAAQLATIDALATMGESAISPIRKQLEQFPDFQGIQSVSGLMLSDGVSINIEANVPPADDNEYTMWRVSELIQQYVNPVSQIRVNTHNKDIRNVDQTNSLWLWEDGEWSVLRLATGVTEQFSSPPSWMASSTPIQIIYPTSAPIVQPPSNPGLVCPRTCATAIALGWTQEQAGQCSNLDRNHNGVACYGS